MDRQEMNLNIWDHSPEEILGKVPEFYAKLDGWMGFGDGKENGEKGIPYWFSFNRNERHISASFEPSGLCFSGKMNEMEWGEWKRKIKKIGAEVLKIRIGEIEEGEVGYETEYLN